MCVVTNPIESLRLSNGLMLQYRESGDPRGIPVILLHGVTDSLRCWKPFTDALPRSLRAIAVSQRGHGDSSKPKGDYGSAAFAGDLAALMDGLGLSRAHIVAHSMSTWIAQRFARDYADRVESLTLIGGFVTLAGNPGVEEMIAAINGMESIERAFAQAFQEATVSKPLGPAYLDMVVEESLKAPAHVWRAAFSAMAGEEPETTPISCRALLISCEKDEFFSDKDRREVASLFVDAQKIDYPLGHAPHWEEPARVAKDIAAFIQAR
jgi:pimeloyl-ACP methyl ester carboxylesterase